MSPWSKKFLNFPLAEIIISYLMKKPTVTSELNEKVLKR